LRFCFALLLALSLPAGPAVAGVIVQMTPRMIEDVIASTGEQAPRLYRLHNTYVWLQFDTPLVRLARKVAETRAQSLPVATHLATPDLVAAELRFFAGPEPRGDSDVGIKTVVIERVDGFVVKPSALKSNVEKAQSRGRHGIKLTGVEGVFPAAALEPGTRFRFKMESGPDQILAPDPAWFDEPR
jgi:hypothetical protein